MKPQYPLVMSALALLACDNALVGRLRPDAGVADAAPADAGVADAAVADAAVGDAAVADAAPADASLAPTCDLTSLAGDAAAMSAPILAYGGASASNDEVLTGRVNNGRQFEVSEDCVVVVELGVWDHRQDGLSRAHAVTLFSLDVPGAGATATPIPGGQAMVGAGDVPLQDGFRLAKLAAPLQLPRGYYAIVAYDFSSEEPYGGGGTLPTAGGAIRDLGFDPFEITTDASPAYPKSSDPNANSSASFRYVIATP